MSRTAGAIIAFARELGSLISPLDDQRAYVDGAYIRDEAHCTNDDHNYHLAPVGPVHWVLRVVGPIPIDLIDVGRVMRCRPRNGSYCLFRI